MSEPVKAKPQAVTGVVTEVRESHRLDEAALTRFLAGRLPGIERGLRISQFEGGQSNPTYLLETDAGRWVLRKKPSGPLLASAHMVEREARILSALLGSKVPVPEVAVTSEDSSILGTPFFIMAYIQGRIVRDPALLELSATDRTAVYKSAVQTIADLHQVDWAARGLTGYGRSTGYVSRQLSRWSQQYQASKLREVPAMEWLMSWLPSRIPPEGPSTLSTIVHGDLRLDNMILAPDEPKVLALIDWELSTIGDPLTDLAYFCMPHHLPQAGAGIRGLLGHDLKTLGIPSVAEIIDSYCLHRQLAAPEPSLFAFHLAFSFFRMAAIAAGIARRREQGTASSIQAGEFAAQLDLFAETGRRIAESSEPAAQTV